jgi:hypothetical protein
MPNLSFKFNLYAFPKKSILYADRQIKQTCLTLVTHQLHLKIPCDWCCASTAPKTQPRRLRFFLFWSFLKKLRNKLVRNLFPISVPFESRYSIRCDLWRSHISAHGATHFHVDIACYVNPNGPTISFGIQSESRYFEWCDSSMSRATPLDVTYFGSKSVVKLLQNYSKILSLKLVYLVNKYFLNK